MDDLLTTRQLQAWLKLDRITIYRMLAAGRLQGFKVGGQWRFSRQQIETWLQDRVSPEPQRTSAAAVVPPSPSILSLSCVRAIQDLCAEAIGTATVTTDLEGSPLVDVSHSCTFCSLIRSTREGRRRCSHSWRNESKGQAYTCHAGLLCASAPIMVDQHPVGQAVVCQFRTIAGQSRAGGQGEPLPDMTTLAKALDLSADELQAAYAHVWVLAPDQLPRVVSLVQRMASTFSHIGQEQMSLLNRLQAISKMSQL